MPGENTFRAQKSHPTGSLTHSPLGDAGQEPSPRPQQACQPQNNGLRPPARAACVKLANARHLLGKPRTDASYQAGYGGGGWFSHL